MTLKEKQAERGQQWRSLIVDQEQSGKSIRAFCQERGVREHSFYFWRVRLRAAGQPMRFALVAPEAKARWQGCEGVEILLTSGERLRIPPGADAATLRLVLSVLREGRA